jgi:hypothetical protein
MLVKHLLSWFLLLVVAITNGVFRQSTYGKVLPDLAAHQISTVTGILATGVVAWFLSRAWPLESPNQAWIVGFCWLLFTILFEFGFGHFVAGHSWQILLADYSIMIGRVWSLFLVWVTVMPYVFYRLSKHAA